MDQLKNRLKNEIEELCSFPSVSGSEKRSADALREKYGEHFDRISVDAVGNHLFEKDSIAEDAPTILLDAHFDEIGMMVTEICDGGFLKFTSVGGLSLAVLQAADVLVFGKRTIRGVITSTPPHLRGSDREKLAHIEDLMIDTGYSREALEDLCPVGTPVGFAPVYRLLSGEKMAGRSFDNKACCAILASAVADTPREALAANVKLVFSCFEETSRLGGVAPAAFSLKPDYALVADVNLGDVPDAPKYETIPLGKGVSIALSAATHRELSLGVRDICDKEAIPYTMIAAPSSTGTNAPTVNLSLGGVPVVDIGLPLKNMHTYVEVLDLADCESLYRLVSKFITDPRLSDRYGNRGKELPL